jgi:hypothetical protein
MAENNNEIVVNENGQAEDDGKYTTGEKLFLGGSIVGIGFLGYLLGNYVVAPAIKKVKKHAEQTAYEQAKAKSRRRKKSESGVPYDEDGEFGDAEDDDNED